MSNLPVKISYTLNTIDAAVRDFWQIAGACHILAFSGDMGAGKTTFISALCRYLMVEDAVSSPTFALINEYHFLDATAAENIIYHMDWYRLNSTAEAINAGMEDCLLQANTNNIWCFVEWPEKAPGLLRGPHMHIAITTLSPYEREMILTPVHY